MVLVWDLARRPGGIPLFALDFDLLARGEVTICKEQTLVQAHLQHAILGDVWLATSDMKLRVCSKAHDKMSLVSKSFIEIQYTSLYFSQSSH